MNFMKRIAMGICLLSSGELAHAGVVTPLSSTRTVSATNRENLPPNTVTFSGPTLGPWQATALASNVNFSDPNFNINGNALAATSSQQSNFSASGISFSGFVFIDIVALFTFVQGASALNRCDTSFHVEGSCDYQFQATITSNNVSETQGFISLRNDTTSQNIFSLTASANQFGTLPTGNYTLSTLIQGNSSGTIAFDGRTQIDAVFTIPTPAAPMLLLAPLAVRRRRS